RQQGIVLSNLGNCRFTQGRMAEARAHYEAALAIHREVGNRRREGVVLDNRESYSATWVIVASRKAGWQRHALITRRRWPFTAKWAIGGARASFSAILVCALANQGVG